MINKIMKDIEALKKNIEHIEKNLNIAWDNMLAMSKRLEDLEVENNGNKED